MNSQQKNTTQRNQKNQPLCYFIRDICVDPAVVLAPMEGVTNIVFRRLMRKIGGMGLTYTEFIPSRGIIENSKQFLQMAEFDKEEWIKFIKEKNTENWINVGDIQKDEEGNPMASSDWRDKYDIYSTPVVYLLDSNKKILAKRISYEQIVEIIALKEK